MELEHPEWLQWHTGQQTLYGYNQNWYQTSFQRTRGCGPTAAAMLLLYVNRREKEPLPYRSDSLAAIIRVLENVWNFITPGRFLGLSSTKKFCKGMAQLLRHYGMSWQSKRLSIPLFHFRRPSLTQVVQFLEAGMAADCPIAFLNLHKGKVRAMDSWHWTVLVALNYDAVQNCYWATCYDGGRTITFDLGLWLKTTLFGGGFVYITTA
jgi:hypothetical protein